VTGAAHRLSERLRRAARLARRSRQIDAYLSAHSERKLQLGTGDNHLDGWLNTDIHDFTRRGDIVYLDLSRPFPFPDGSFDLVYSEHVIEHVDYPDGLQSLRESHRVLRPGGRIRIATPSLERLMRLYDAEQSDVQLRYLRWARESFVEDADADLPGFVVNNFVRAWGHLFIYDTQTLRHALETAGFVDVEEHAVGESGDERLRGLERHIPEAAEFNEYETIVLEARKS
jgi:predicted SAM-dependent methyltransferase